jgi:hypothetical protein
MQATTGDRIVVHGHRVGQPERGGEITAVLGAGGAPPYVVRWDDKGTESLFFPGPDATVQHLGRTDAAARQESTHGQP